MRAVVQRVLSASVTVESAVVSSIDHGLLVLVGLDIADTEHDAAWLAEKLAHVRIFEDAEGKMNRSVLDVAGAVLLVPNFTLAGDARKGRRPSFDRAMRPEHAEPLFARLADLVRARGVRVQTGVFRAEMRVALVNDGPVTIILDSPGPPPA
ncbi:MAG: D-aminoacyl-tRNA deacylase [Planctomycetota bacterium]|nr:D-aminoacyl-tRNA deacylase [Planctomycetota bacterium]